MKTDMQKLHKIMEIAIELYEMDPEYFTHEFFDMYYQMKKKSVIDELCNGDEELKRRIWSASNFFKELLKIGTPPGKAFNIAYRSKNVDKEIFSSVVNKCRAFRGVKKTRFKDF